MMMTPWPASLLENKTIFVAGASGFLGKLFVEEILRVQPNVKKLYLLLRAPDSHSATNKFHHEVTEKEVFRVLKEQLGTEFPEFISEKVVAVAGDVSLEDLGIKDVHLKQQIWTETDVFLHSAATTAFDQSFDDTNLKKLRKQASKKDDERREELNLDTGSISWEDYFMNIHFPGLVKFVMKKSNSMK